MSTQTTPTRARGILMHVSSLPGEYGCGSFGQEAVDFIDLLAACGYTYWQTLPFGVPDRSGSPYKSYSAFAGNPLLIDLQTLYREGLLTDQDRLSEAARCQGMQYRCIFTELTPDRYALLKRASSRVTERRRAEIEAFIAARQPLSEFCEFMAKYHPTVDISNQEEYNTELFFWKFTQHAFFTQWQSIREYANAHGVKIIGDIPIYVDLDSADVHYHPELFLLDKERRPEAVAGVPPDYFSPDGQMWGNPLYNWSRMKKDGYAWWCERVRFQLEIFDGLRIDHFRGLSAYFSIPTDAPNAKSGKWVKGPGMALIKKLREVTGDALIIAEDLGDIDEDAARLVRDSGFPGMRVFQFAFLGGDNPHLPHHYPEHCVAYSGTHDNTTLLAYIYEMDEATRNRMMEYIGYHGHPLQCGDAILRTISRSAADLVIFPIQDILGYGVDTRMNIPGVPEGNWGFRVTREQLATIDRPYRRHLGELYGRNATES
jgi:4-alpha-glucanotransferase